MRELRFALKSTIPIFFTCTALQNVGTQLKESFRIVT